MSRQSTVLYTQLYCIILRTLSHSCFCAGLHGHRKEEGVRRGGEECIGRNEVVLTVCSHREESTCGGLETYSGRVGGGGDECSSTETLLFLDFWFPKSQKVFEV